VGRALQLVLLNLGGARPDAIDMSALGNPGKFSYCIAENEEENPWEPLHVERGLSPGQSAVTLFAAEPPHGVSEHTARRAAVLLKAIAASLACVWSHRVCAGREAMGRPLSGAREDDSSATVGARTTSGSSSSPILVCQCVPIETTTAVRGRSRPRRMPASRSTVSRATGNSVRLNRFIWWSPVEPRESFSAVIGSWSTGARGSQMVTYGIEESKNLRI